MKCKSCPDYPLKDIPGTEDLDIRFAVRIMTKMNEAEEKALDSLARYKFFMFGYWAGVWAHLNEVGPQTKSPFGRLVTLAKDMRAEKIEGMRSSRRRKV